jgi:hypothetical protein
MSLQNLRSYRFGSISIAYFDLISSVLGMILLFVVMKVVWFKDSNNMLAFIVAGALLAVPFGIIMHVLFGQKTPLNTFLRLS